METRCLLAREMTSGINALETIVTLADGLDFKRNVNFSKPTFPPPIMSTSNSATFKNTGYSSFFSKPNKFSLYLLLRKTDVASKILEFYQKPQVNISILFIKSARV